MKGKEMGEWPLTSRGIDKGSSAIRVFCISQLTSLLTDHHPSPLSKDRGGVRTVLTLAPLKVR